VAGGIALSGGDGTRTVPGQLRVASAPTGAVIVASTT